MKIEHQDQEGAGEDGPGEGKSSQEVNKRRWEEQEAFNKEDEDFKQQSLRGTTLQLRFLAGGEGLFKA
jgi:hypothetical protein